MLTKVKNSNFFKIWT